MGGVEILHRFTEQWGLITLRLQNRGLRRFSKRLDPKNHAFCQASSARLPALPWDLNLASELARRHRDGPVNMLGFPWHFNNDDDVWQIAPDTGRRWPRRFFTAIPYREGNPYGDVRVLWEPSRLQHLLPLALMAKYHWAGDERARAVAVIEEQLLSWARSNPPFFGAHYISAMECGLRLLAVCHTLDLVRPWLRQPNEIWHNLLGLVYTHARLIERRLSLHSSVGNHTIAECAGLLYAAILFPEMRRANLWRVRSLKILREQACVQVLPDGGGAEQALWYNALVIDLLGLSEHLLRHYGHPVPVALVDAVARGKNFLGTFANGPAELPRIGDRDDGYALSSCLRLSWPSKEVAEKTRAKPLLKRFPDSGYSLIQDPAKRMRLILDHGPLGKSPTYAHGHADALSVCLTVSDQEVFLIPGTYTYTAHPKWRSYFRSTRAHNTVVVDGCDQAKQESAFLWSSPYHAKAVHWKETDTSIELLALHSGYECRGVNHWRGISYLKGEGQLLVWDQFKGDGDHDLALHWHLGALPAPWEDHYVLRSGVQAKVLGGSVRIASGETDPILGWRSPVYGIKQPAPVLVTSYSGKLPHEFLTVIGLDDSLPQLSTFSASLSQLRHLTTQ